MLSGNIMCYDRYSFSELILLKEKIKSGLLIISVQNQKRLKVDIDQQKLGITCTCTNM